MSTPYHRVRELVGDRGPCAFCGHRYGQAHRIVDAILERVRTGESVAGVADDYGLDPGLLADALREKPRPDDFWTVKPVVGQQHLTSESH